MVQKLARAVYILQPREPDLRDDRTEFPARRRDPVCRRAIPRREHLAGDHERRRVRPEVLEEVAQAEEEYERLLRARRCGELVVSEAHDDEEDREHREAH